jgi:hypothetical protein
MTDVLLPERVEIAESIGPGVVWPVGSAGSALAPDAGYPSSTVNDVSP